MTPQEYFRGSLREASSAVGVTLHKWTEYYLVDLLSRKAPLLPIDNPLALQLKAAVEEDKPRPKFEKYRDLGDSSLLLLGFFRGVLKDRTVSKGYVASMGSSAYLVTQSLSLSYDGFQEAYRDLNAHFTDFVYVISTVRKMTEGTVVISGSLKG